MKMEDRDRQIYRDGYEDGKRNGEIEGEKRGERRGEKRGEKRGEEKKLYSLVEKKLARGKSAEEIADALEEDLSVVQRIISELKARRE